MNWEAIAAVGEVTGSLAVVGTLADLADLVVRGRESYEALADVPVLGAGPQSA